MESSAKHFFHMGKEFLPERSLIGEGEERRVSPQRAMINRRAFLHLNASTCCSSVKTGAGNRGMLQETWHHRTRLERAVPGIGCAG
jgi:hypothetical protein